jgi:N-formylglutamate deformylase
MSKKAIKIYDLKTPARKAVPLVIDSPHSGTLLPEDFHFTCSLADLRQSDEFYVDRFGERGVKYGATFLRALVSRAYIDLNRPIGDLHPSLCSEKIPWPLNKSKRVTHGIGLIRHLVRPEQPIYDRKLTLGEIQHRIIHYYDPYYAALENALLNAKAASGRVLHINMHGMPSIGADSKPMPDIVLGDHDGHSCGRPYRETVKNLFESYGLKVLVNDPYKGVELTKRFAKPRQGVHSLQIEVNKTLYMDENTLAATDDLQELLPVFDDLWATLADMLSEAVMPKAAE